MDPNQNRIELVRSPTTIPMLEVFHISDSCHGTRGNEDLAVVAHEEVRGRPKATKTSGTLRRRRRARALIPSAFGTLESPAGLFK